MKNTTAGAFFWLCSCLLAKYADIINQFHTGVLLLYSCPPSMPVLLHEACVLWFICRCLLIPFVSECSILVHVFSAVEEQQRLLSVKNEAACVGLLEMLADYFLSLLPSLLLFQDSGLQTHLSVEDTFTGLHFCLFMFSAPPQHQQWAKLIPISLEHISLNQEITSSNHSTDFNRTFTEELQHVSIIPAGPTHLHHSHCCQRRSSSPHQTRSQMAGGSERSALSTA